MLGTDVSLEIVLIVAHIGTVVAQELSLLRMISSEVFGKVHLAAGVVRTLRTGVTSLVRPFLQLPLTLLVLNIFITEVTSAPEQRQSLGWMERPPVSVERLSVVTPVGAARAGAGQPQFPHVNSLPVSF